MRSTVTVIAFALLSVAVFAQSSFRAGTEIVPIYATVRGADGHLVTGLKASDFEILDRGVPVPVALFSDQPQPITLAMLVDMSGGLFEVTRYDVLKKALLAFVAQLEPQDRARIGTFSGNEIALGYHLTSDHMELSRVIDEEVWPWGGRRPLWNAVGSALAALTPEPGRRIVLVITNGPDTADLPGFPGVKEVERAMADADLMVYGVSLFTANQVSHAEPTSRLTLGELVDATGGGYFQAAPYDRANYIRGGPDYQLVSTLPNVVEELRHQYAMGFVPSHRDARVGTIEVRVNRRNATVTARKSYRAPGGRS